MTKKKVPLEPVTMQEAEADAIAQLDQLLSSEDSHAKFVGSNGKEVLIPESVYRILRQVIHAIASGQHISVLTPERQLTTQEAADILSVSRPFMVKLLEAGEIPYIKVGSHRRVRFEDLMAYKEKRDMKRGKLLDELIEMTEESGLYEDS
ncbi:helix-turn-helix domain-containing protein [Kamptonema formosum]|uniref:helix-turn-helix domain-containing protein n=1 Tax=Kamptonema formosum TaxID=331992 RepID=UPI0003492A57|nr:helix-turn-helix domain-containing protein [Oscillatoria sp. PCC 10802]